MTVQSEIPKVGDLNVKIGSVIYKQGAVLDISTATIKRIKAQRPNGTFAWEKDATFETDGTDGKLYYKTVLASDLDQAGTWTYWSYIEMAGSSLTSDPETFLVGEVTVVGTTKYISVDDIKRSTGTSYDDNDIAEMIIEAEDELEEEVSARLLTADPLSPLLKGAVKIKVKMELLDRMRMDGTKPKQLISGNLTIIDDNDAQMDRLEAQYKSKLDMYQALNDTPEIIAARLAQITPDTTDLEETVVREDHEMPSYNLDQSKVKEYHDQAEGGNEDTDD